MTEDDRKAVLDGRIEAVMRKLRDARTAREESSVAAVHGASRADWRTDPRKRLLEAQLLLVSAYDWLDE